MMCSCAGLQPVASINFIREKLILEKLPWRSRSADSRSYHRVTILMNLDISMVTYLVIVIIFYTGIQYILKSRKTAAA